MHFRVISHPSSRNNIIQCLFLALAVATTKPIPTHSAAVRTSEKDAKITLFNVQEPDSAGVFKYAFATSNGIEVQVAGSPLEIIGLYKYTSPEGIPIELRYIADELGVHAVGRHLPQPPPIPDYILRSIMYNRLHAGKEMKRRRK